MADWRTVLGNRVCSLRGCSNKPTKRLNLAAVGLQRFKVEGLGGWEPNVHRLELVLCHRCYEETTSKLPVDPRLLNYVTEFAHYASDKLKSEKVPVGEALDEFVLEEVRMLAIQWKNGNKEHVANRLEELPVKVSLAILAGLCAQSIGIHDYLNKRLR